MKQPERIFKTEQLIKARRVVPFRTLLDELEVSRATLKRELMCLRDIGEGLRLFAEHCRAQREAEELKEDGIKPH